MAERYNGKAIKLKKKKIQFPKEPFHCTTLVGPSIQDKLHKRSLWNSIIVLYEIYNTFTVFVWTPNEKVDDS